MFIPNYGNIYGSYSRMSNLDATHSYRWNIMIERTQIIAIDQPSQRCFDAPVANTSACIARHIEKKLRCSPTLHGSNFPAKSKPCNSTKDLQELVRISMQLQEADANEIYGITDCMPSCLRSKYQVKDAPLQPYRGSESWDAKVLDVALFIKNGLFEEREQYLIYDWDSFIADVGGFLGLLLGWSMFSLYQDIADLMSKLCKKFLSKV